ncbi:MAG: hypothetical protein L0207_03755 [Chlamydiae bacterium]|nr:hypothetical protein [Chlamydiota bacterium]
MAYKFKKAGWIYSTIGSFILLFWICALCVVRQKDRDFYQKLVQEKEMACSSSYSSTNQHRKNVRKDIWFVQDDDQRLHYQIESLSSTLTFIPQNDKFQLVEILDNLKCWMQDKLFKTDRDFIPMQQMRYMEAAKGTYHYTSQEFDAEGVSLAMFRLPGHELPQSFFLDSQKAFLKGIAKNISFKISGKTPQFQARNFKAGVADQ